MRTREAAELCVVLLKRQGEEAQAAAAAALAAATAEGERRLQVGVGCVCVDGWEIGEVLPSFFWLLRRF